MGSSVASLICAVYTQMCVPGVPDVRIEVSRAGWSKHWRQCVWLTCLTPTRDTLASRCSNRTAQKLPRCGTGNRAKSTYCDLSSLGPALFEIWWPDIYLGGPYGPVKDKMYWPDGLKSAPGQQASAYVEGWLLIIDGIWRIFNYFQKLVLSIFVFLVTLSLVHFCILKTLTEIIFTLDSSINKVIIMIILLLLWWLYAAIKL